MKKTIFRIIFIISCLILVQSDFVFSADEQEIILSAEKLVAAWNKAFAKEVDSVSQFLSVESFRETPNDMWCVRRYKLIDGTLGHDIKKTDSLVSPYVLIISLKALESENCGSPNANWGYNKLLKKVYGFKTIEDALNNRLPTDFYHGGGENNLKINYAYQKGKWIFKGGNDEFLRFSKFVSTIKENNAFNNLMSVE